MKFTKNELDDSFNNLCFLVNFLQKETIQGWLPKKAVMRFFDYGATQMLQFEKEYNLEVSKIKGRKFYSVQSILNLIEQHKTTFK